MRRPKAIAIHADATDAGASDDQGAGRPRASVLRLETTGRFVGEGQVISSNLVYERQPSPAPPPASVYDTPVSHIHLRERSSFPSLVRFPDSFGITRLESSS